jgi:hypothetical protein
VERSCDNCSNIVQFTLGAIAAAVEVVGALVRPDATVDGTRNSDCDADDGANDDERNENADCQSLVLAVASPVMLESAASARTALATLLLVCQTSLPQSLVGGPHGALLVVAADGKLLAEGILVIVVVGGGAGCDVAVLEVFLASHVGGLRGGLVVRRDTLVGGRRVRVERRVRRERGVIGESGIVVGGGLARHRRGEGR